MAYSQGSEYAYVLYKDDYTLPNVIIWTNVSLNVPCTAISSCNRYWTLKKEEKEKEKKKITDDDRNASKTTHKCKSYMQITSHNYVKLTRFIELGRRESREFLRMSERVYQYTITDTILIETRGALT